MNVTTELVRDLMEIGYVAAGRGLAPLAEQIFAGVEAARPESDAPAIGRAVAALNAGEPADAAEILRNSLQTHPESDVVRAFFGLALRRAGMTQQSDQVLNELVATSRDPSAAALADAILHPADE